MSYLEIVPTGLEAAEAASKNEPLNRLEAVLSDLPQVECPLVHTFTPGLYVREIRVPANTFIITKIHKTEHPYVVSAGEVSVWVDGVGVKRIQAPFMGVTKAGTRRAIYVHSDVVWTTFHPTQETDLEKLEEEIIFKHTVASEELGNQVVAEITASLGDQK